MDRPYRVLGHVAGADVRGLGAVQSIPSLGVNAWQSGGPCGASAHDDHRATRTDFGRNEIERVPLRGNDAAERLVLQRSVWRELDAEKALAHGVKAIGLDPVSEELAPPLRRPAIIDVRLTERIEGNGTGSVKEIVQA